MNSRILWACLSFLAGMTGAIPSMSAAALPLDTAVRIGHLDNGLTYYIRHNEYPKDRVDFYIAQKVGSIQEEENQRGLAHFLEHMCFNGTKHFAGNRLIRYCESIGVQFGSNLNAYTSTDETVYNICSVPTTKEKAVDSCLYILCDWADGLLLDPKEIDKERGVIHEEWRMRTSAEMRMFERNLPTLYPNSKYGKRMPIGLMSVVDSFPPKALRHYYETWYRPDLQGIIVVGNIKVEEVEAKIKQIFGSIKRPKNAAPRVYYPVPDNDSLIVVVDKDKELVQSTIQIFLKHAATPDHEKSSPEYLRDSYLSGQAIKMLNERLNEITQKTDAPFNSAGAANENYLFAKTKDALTLGIQPKEGKGAQALSVVLREAMRAAQFGFTEGEYQRACDEYISGFETTFTARKKLENNVYTSQCIHHFLDNENLFSIADWYELSKQQVATLPVDSVNARMRSWMTSLDTNTVVVAFYPDKEGLLVPSAESLRAALKATATETLSPFVDKTNKAPLLAELPAAGRIVKEKKAGRFGYKEWLLSNGIRVYSKKTDFNDYEVLMNAVSKGGTSLLPTSDIVNANLLNQVLANNGLGAFNSLELEKKLKGKQVSIAPSLSKFTENLSGGSTSKDLRTLFELTHLYFTDVKRDTLNYQTVIRQNEAYYRNKSVSPETAFHDSITTTIYQHNSRMQPMTLERLHQANYDEILRLYHARFANPADFAFIFTGCFNEDSLKTFVCNYLANLPTQKTRETVQDAGENLWKGIETNCFERVMESPQAYLYQGWTGPLKSSIQNKVIIDATGLALNMINLERVREEASLVYAINSSASLKSGIHDFYVLQTACPVNPEKCDSTLLLINQALDTLATYGAQEKYLSKVKEYMIKRYNDRLLKNNYWSGLQAELLCFGKDDFKGYKEAIEGLTPKAIQKFIKNNVLKQKNCATVIMLPQSKKSL
ncbi:MAG: insulinase family protein [Bacteroidaceae bacterium]